MIQATFYKNQNDELYGFKLLEHGESVVCAAVSALSINTANSIERFTGTHIICEFEEEGGFIYFELPEIRDGKTDEKAVLLLNSLELGINSIAEQYKGQIRVKSCSLK